MTSTVLIPAYKPDKKLITLLHELKESGLDSLVVDDGSGIIYSEIFSLAEEYAEVLHHEKNKGKGAALRTGIEHIKNAHPECEYFITADADGQHKLSDILKVRDALESGERFVLSERALDGDIPTTSKLGNGLSRVVYAIMSGHYFHDNQSGLRGFRADNADWLLSVGGDRYDYELSMIFAADKQRIPIASVPIETVYIDSNKSSHFDPLRDTLRIYRQLFKTAWVSVFAFVLWEIAVFLCGLFFSPVTGIASVFLSGILSAVLCMVLGKHAAYRRLDYSDSFRTFSCSAMRSSFCAVICCIFYLIFGTLPLFAVFNAALIIDLPIEYYYYKLIGNIKQ